MLDILLEQMQKEVDDIVTILGPESREATIQQVVQEYNLNWVDTKFCISRLTNITRGTYFHGNMHLDPTYKEH